MSLVILGFIYGAVLIHYGFHANEEPPAVEKFVTRLARNLSIPSSANTESVHFLPRRQVHRLGA